MRLAARIRLDCVRCLLNLGAYFDDVPAREIDFQQDFTFLLKAVVREQHEFEGIRFEDARMEFPVADGRADIALLLPGGHPFVLIETKRKNGREQKDIDPLSPRVIRQALGYASIAGSPYFGTANREYLAVFRRPAADEEFRIERHRVYVTAIPVLNEEFAKAVIENVVTYHRAATDQDRARVATGLDWTFIIRLRSFVDWLSRRIEPAIARLLREDEAFQTRMRAFEKETGSKVESPSLSRQMAYILTNKIVFHKVLERSYPRLDALTLNGASSARQIIATLDRAFADAADVTGNFEAIFSAGVYDEVALSEDSHDLLDISEGIEGFVEDMGTYRLEELEADVIGHVYESLIPEEDRHRLGQFYTPPAVAEFLVRWAVRGPEDIVLDPAAGSGTFLVKAYQRLRDLGAEAGVRMPDVERHRKVLSQLYALDINPFPAHLTAMNLAMRDVRHPVTEMNILERDFFKVSPGSVAYVPYAVRTAQGEQRRQVTVPLVDAIVANPPYTRWTEIPDSTREAIQARLGNSLREYGLTALVRGGVETAIYQHFVLHGCDFLKEGARLAMIISSSWLQTDVGVKFAAFVLDHFKVHAIVDIGPRIFPVPIVGYCLILLERSKDEAVRQATRSLFAYVDKPIAVDELTELVAHPEMFAERLPIQVVAQSSLPRDRKWVEVLFGFPSLDTKIRARTIPVDELYAVTRGNIKYCAEKKRGLGANEFFYLDDEKVRMRGLAGAVHPAIPSIRNVHYFSWTRSDWQALRKTGGLAHLFICSVPKSRLSSEVASYVRWGETQCRTRDEAVCSESQACAERARDRTHYAGWYDLGEVRDGAFFSSRYAQYRRRFVALKTDAALDDDFLVFARKARLRTEQERAVLACLNSSLGQVYVEIQGRTTGGGMASMEVEHASSLRVPDVRTLTGRQVRDLVSALDSLEAAARKQGGAHDRDTEERLSKEFDDLDAAVAEVIGLSGREMKKTKELWKALAARRTARASEPTPETVRGTDRTLGGPPRRRRARSKDQGLARTLDEFRSDQS